VSLALLAFAFLAPWAVILAACGDPTDLPDLDAVVVVRALA